MVGLSLLSLRDITDEAKERGETIQFAHDHVARPTDGHALLTDDVINGERFLRSNLEDDLEARYMRVRLASNCIRWNHVTWQTVLAFKDADACRETGCATQFRS